MGTIEAVAAGAARRNQRRSAIRAATAGEFAVSCREAGIGRQPAVLARVGAGTAWAIAARFIRPVLARVRAAIDRVNERARRRRARHHLRGLPDHLLRDMGIDRPEIAFVTVFGTFSGRRGGLER